MRLKDVSATFTDVVIAFAVFSPPDMASVKMDADTLGKMEQYPGDVAVLQDRGQRVHLALGGEQIFPTDLEGVKGIAQQLVSLVTQYNLDGVDIDDEHVLNEGKSIVYLIALVKAVREELPRDKTLSLTPQVWLRGQAKYQVKGAS
jgi:chitinase